MGLAHRTSQPLSDGSGEAVLECPSGVVGPLIGQKLKRIAQRPNDPLMYDMYLCPMTPNYNKLSYHSCCTQFQSTNIVGVAAGFALPQTSLHSEVSANLSYGQHHCAALGVPVAQLDSRSLLVSTTLATSKNIWFLASLAGLLPYLFGMFGVHTE